MGEAFAFSLSAAFNPTLLAALMVMLLSTNAKRLMLGYLLGAYATSITAGLVIVFALPASSAVSTTRNTLSPALDLAFGMIALLIALVLGTGPHERVEGRREKRKLAKEKKGPPRWRRALDEGSPRVAFAVGAALSLPGASYLIALDILHKQDLATGAIVVCVIAFCLIEMLLLELPLLGFALAPDSTVSAVKRFQTWISRDGRRIAARAALVIGVLLVLRGAIELLS
jgi:hypothetical protein